MNGLNFFSWIRDGVRQSVLLGVSDAVEQLGTPAPMEDLHPSVAGFLQLERTNSPAVPALTDPPSRNSNGRKRLGKSLKDIGAPQTN